MVVSCLDDLERILGHRFRDPALAERALTHRSAVADRAAAADNEQLEYLGDAVLGMLVSEHLTGAFPDWSEGQLSRGRAQLVNAASLCAVARRLHLGDFLLLGRGEEKTGGRGKPTLLADAFEAIVAAIYLDAGLVPARQFVARALLDGAVGVHGVRLGLSDPKSALQEFLQARGLGTVAYQVVREDGPDHQKLFSVRVVAAGELVSATGIGANKKEAEQSAAEQALEQLRARMA